MFFYVHCAQVYNNNNNKYETRTWHAIVADEQVRLEVLRARISAIEHRVRDADTAGSSAGADGIHVCNDVGETSHVTVVAQDAATEPHTTVQGSSDDNHR